VSDQLNTFIEAQHALNVTMAASLGRIEESLKNTNQRLLGGDGQQGAIPYMNDKVEKVSARVGSLETWKAGTLKWVGGVVAVLTLEGTALALYINHVGKAAQDVLNIIKPH